MRKYTDQKCGNNDKQDRREFLVKPVQWAAAAGLLSAVSPSLFGQTPASPSPAKIITRKLGKTGITLPIVSMGVMNADVPGLLRRSYEVGVRHFDTAASYQGGRNEEMVGSMIKEMGVRDKVTIATKANLRGQTGTPAQVKAAFRLIFEGSLKRLQMDHVDVLFLHGADSAAATNSEGVIEAMAELKKEGKIRFAGVSSHMGTQAVLEEATRLGVFDVVLCTINYTHASNKGLLDSIASAAKSGIGVMAMKTQAGGMARPDPKLPRQLPLYSQTALLKWVLHNESITSAIPGYTTYDQLEQNFTVASNLEYTADEKAFLGDKTFVASAQFCQQCGECRGDCPRGVDVPGLMRTHMYAVQYRNRDMARNTLAQVERGKGLDACGECSQCLATCRNHVNIPSKIGDLKQSRYILA